MWRKKIRGGVDLREVSGRIRVLIPSAGAPSQAAAILSAYTRPWWQNKVEAVGGNLKPPTLISLRVGVTFLWHYLTCKSNKACTPSVHWRILSGYGFLGDSHGGPNSWEWSD